MESSESDLLIDDVRYGRRTPAEAEAEAVRLGLGPFARRPDPADFDPMNEAWWSLLMTIAWILWRSKDQVREFWDKYRVECWDWHFRPWRIGLDGEIHEGSFLEQRRPATLSLLMVADSYDAVCGGPCRYARTAKEVKQSLWSELARGRLTASAVDGTSHKRVKVRADEWIDLETYEDDHGKDIVRPRPESAAGRRGYGDVRFERSAVMACWAPCAPDESGFAGAELTTPTGTGYMPLSCAAQWIATCGNMIDPGALEADDWRRAYMQLVDAMASEEAKAIGMRAGEMQPIESYKFAAIRIDFPWAPALDQDPANSVDMHLRGYYFNTQEEWEDEFSDALVKGRDVQWTKIMISKRDVAERWPFHLETTETSNVGRAALAERPDARSDRKSQPARERALGMIRELYPKGIPGQAAEPNTNLCRRVGEKLKQAGLPGVSDDTILRAAGRRK